MRDYELETPIQEFALKTGRRFGWNSQKMVSESKRGYPDCQFTRAHPTCSGAIVGILIETKAVGKDARQQQLIRHRELREAGWTVHVSSDRLEIYGILSSV